LQHGRGGERHEDEAKGDMRSTSRETLGGGGDSIEDEEEGDMGSRRKE